jgi:hypothetical protein
MVFLLYIDIRLLKLEFFFVRFCYVDFAEKGVICVYYKQERNEKICVCKINGRTIVPCLIVK